MIIHLRFSRWSLNIKMNICFIFFFIIKVTFLLCSLTCRVFVRVKNLCVRCSSIMVTLITVCMTSIPVSNVNLLDIISCLQMVCRPCLGSRVTQEWRRREDHCLSQQGPGTERALAAVGKHHSPHGCLSTVLLLPPSPRIYPGIFRVVREETHVGRPQEPVCCIES